MLIVKVGEGRVEEGNRCAAFRSKPGRLSQPHNQWRKHNASGWEAKALASACIFDIQRTERRASEWQNFRSNDHLRTVTRFCKAI
jgi:hypothetical protein